MNSPKHVAIIMDGNGRWGIKKKKSRNYGHSRGVAVVKDIISAAIKKKIKYLTLYTFSTENWKRPEKEINFILRLLENYIQKELIMSNNKFINTITSIFEKIAINRTRQALAFLSDNELEAMGITRTSLDTGDFYNYKEVANFPTKKISRIKSTKAKAA